MQPACSFDGVILALNSGMRLHLTHELLALCFYYDAYIFTAFSVCSVIVSCSGFNPYSGLQSQFAHHLTVFAKSRVLKSIECSHI